MNKSTVVPSRLSIRSIKNREDLLNKAGLSKKEVGILLDNSDISLYDKTLEAVALRIHKNSDFLIQVVGNVYDAELESKPKVKKTVAKKVEVKKTESKKVEKVELSKAERVALIKDNSKLLKGNKTSFDQLKRKPSIGSKSETFIKAYFNGKSIYKIAQDEGSPYSFVRGVLLRYNIITEKK